MSKANIIVVDDEELIRWSLKEHFQDAGYDVATAETGEEFFRTLERESFDIAILDYKLPDTDGLKILSQLREVDPEISAIMITAHGNVDHAITAIKGGAYDYITKPFQKADLLLRVEKVLEANRLKREISHLRREHLQKFGFDKMIGSSPPMRKVFELIERIIESGEPTLLIQGESGTGKDLLAKAIHNGGPRSSGPFMNITCTALPENLMESELFGHEKGAFTDARTQKKGLVELADHGTLFLDEIGDMSLNLQAKLLRLLEDRKFRRVGGQAEISVDVQVIAASNQDLEKRVRDGGFREDLYFRLKVIPIFLPPLRERPEDIPLLVQHFINEFNRDFGKNVKGVEPALMKQLSEYHWQGNMRELRNAIERAMILNTQDHLSAENLPRDLLDSPRQVENARSAVKLTHSGLSLEALEKDLVEQALELTHGNQTRAGRLLGLNLDKIRHRMKKYGLKRSN